MNLSQQGCSRVPAGPVRVAASSGPGPAASLHKLKALHLGGKSFKIHW